MAEGIARRTFLGTGVAAGALMAQSQTQNSSAADPFSLPRPAETRRGDMLYRTFGKTGESVSVIGVGGSDIGKAESDDLATRIIRTAIDRGVTFMDNSWDYNDGDGKAETRMGKALADGYRQKVFLMTKIDGRTKEAAAKQIDESLKRLKTDHVDLLQFHEVIRMEDPDRIFAPGGAVEAFLDAKKAGKLRYIGFTGHKDPAIHLRMLELARDKGFHFDAVLFPSNIMDWNFRSFVHQVLPVAVQEGIAVQTMKPLGHGALLKSGTVTAAECLQYAMSMPVSVVIHGMDKMEYLNSALDVIRKFQPMTLAQVTALAAKANQAAHEGKYELYKTTSTFDSTAENPKWLG